MGLELEHPSSGDSVCLRSKVCSRRDALSFHTQGEQHTSTDNRQRIRTQDQCVRRNLFGPVDHDRLQQDFQRTLWSSIELAGKKWNFDFVRDMPSEGMLEWEELGYQDVPAFYRSQLLGRQKNLHCAVAEPRACCMAVPPREKSGAREKERQEGKRRQVAVTEYYSVKKQLVANNPSAVKS